MQTGHGAGFCLKYQFFHLWINLLINNNFLFLSQFNQSIFTIRLEYKSTFKTLNVWIVQKCKL